MRQTLTLYKQLLRRGFLVEKEGDRIFLTNNAYLKTSRWRKPETLFFESDEIPFDHVSSSAVRPDFWPCPYDRRAPADQEVLQHLLARIGDPAMTFLGNEHRAWALSMRDRELHPHEVEALFRWPAIRSESWNDSRYCGRTWGLKRGHAPKVPLALMEAHIALFVKAFSAVGCWIWVSCEGHEDERLPICVIGDGPHTRWARHLMKDVEAAGLGGLRMVRPQHYCALVPDTADFRRAPKDLAELEAMRRCYMDIGEYVYENRYRLREERAVWARRQLALARFDDEART